jgi:hypothetical protein
MNMSPKIRRSGNLTLAVPIKASGNYLGNDGNWSTFEITAGTTNPPQVFDVLVSLTSYGAWLASPGGCPSTASDSSEPGNCAKLRGVAGSGDGWNESLSSSNTFQGAAELFLNPDFDLSVLNPSEVYIYPSNLTNSTRVSTDQIQMTVDTTSGGTITAEPVVMYGTVDLSFFVDTIGVGYGSTKISNNVAQDSLITVLANSGRISSKSVGYTAGAYYSKPFLVDLKEDFI